MDLFLRYLEAERFAHVKGNITACREIFNEFKEMQREYVETKEKNNATLKVILAAMELLIANTFDKPIDYISLDRDFKEIVLGDDDQVDYNTITIYPGILAAYYFEAVGFMEQRHCINYMVEAGWKLYCLVRNKSNFKTKLPTSNSNALTLEQICWRYVFLLPCFESPFFVKECRFDETYASIMRNYKLSDDRISRDYFNLIMYTKTHICTEGDINEEKRRECLEYVITEINMNPTLYSLKLLSSTIYGSLKYISHEGIKWDVRLMQEQLESFKDDPQTEDFCSEKNKFLDILIEELEKIIVFMLNETDGPRKFYFEDCESIKQRDVDEDLKNLDLIKFLTWIANRDGFMTILKEAQKLHRHYVCYFHPINNEERTRLMYIKPAFFQCMLKFFIRSSLQLPAETVVAYCDVKQNVADRSLDLIDLAKLD